MAIFAIIIFRDPQVPLKYSGLLKILSCRCSGRGKYFSSVKRTLSDPLLLLAKRFEWLVRSCGWVDLATPRPAIERQSRRPLPLRHTTLCPALFVS